MTTQRRKAALAIAAALLTAVIVAALAVSPSHRSAGEPSAAIPVYRMEGDHAIYPSVGTVTDGAPVIVTGEVLSHVVEPGESPGVDALGDPLPAIPHTNYSVKVLSVLKGGVATGATLVVSISGGTTSKGDFVLDGAPEINDGDVAMFFLEPIGGKYFPLAGGAAVAVKVSGERFEMPPEATGSEPIEVTEDAVAAAVDQPASPPPAAPQAPAVSAAAPSAAPAPPTRRRCRAGFRKKRVKGKVRCVKRHKARRHAKAKHG